MQVSLRDTQLSINLTKLGEVEYEWYKKASSAAVNISLARFLNLPSFDFAHFALNFFCDFI